MDYTILTNPTFLELDDAYRGLPAFSSLVVSTNQPESMLPGMEQVGFVAMHVTFDSDKSNRVSIKAYKGKHGPCHFIGDIAIYTGQALAALDDDLHLLIKDVPCVICEKTKRIFVLPPYHSIVACISAGEEDRLQTIKDFEGGVAILEEMFKNSSAHSTDSVNIFYPGPFRLLILQDGTVMRRGRCNSVPRALADNLVKMEGCSVRPDGESSKPEYFQENYSLRGSLFMKETMAFMSMEENHSVEADFSQLQTIDNPLRKRLLNAIAKEQKYFVLVGSDMDDETGCCPSKEVTNGNRLVRHGVLSSLRESTTTDSCPVTIFAFRNELEKNDAGFTSNINASFRKNVEEHLRRRPSSVWMSMIKWALLVFVGITLAFAMKQCRELNSVKVTEKDVMILLNPSGKNQIQLILFHNQKRCFQCLEMERLINEVVNDHFSNESGNGEFIFKSISMDDPKFIGLAERYQLFAATLVVVVFDGERIILEKPLLLTGSLYRDEEAFKVQLKKDIEDLLYDD